ncbi:MAG: peptidoglycan-binding protein [Candidatus Scatovivens sp.]
MAKILIYNNYSNRMETYNRSLTQAMPYNSNRTLTVNEFRGSSKSNILWTDVQTMESWNSFRYIYGRPIYVGFAFKRPWEGGHGTLSQHYAGVAFDVGQNLTSEGRAYMRNLAVSSRIWSYVEPAADTPRWVHFDDRWVASGYPLTRLGSRGNYVCIAQDALINLGYNTGGLDGVFGNRTYNSVKSFQSKNGLSADGILGPITWRALMNQTVGSGSNSNTIN